jgi:hypothetical protein
MADQQATDQSKRLLNLIQTGIDSANNAAGTLTNSQGGTGQTNPAHMGREYVNSLYPNEIEYYAAAFELVNGDGFTEDFFSFPVMFKSYRENRPTNTNIEKTMSGVVITANPTFIPFDIHMTGNFGRKFKKINTDIPANQPTPSNNSTSNSTQQTVVVVPVFSTEYKTGYGCYKIMERMLLKAQSQDSNFKPYQLFFYNLALNSNFLVEPMSIEPNQNRESSNMIWEYNIHLKAVAPASSINKNYKSSMKLITDFNKLTQETVFQSDEIEQYKKDREVIDKKQSAVSKILQRQAQGRAFGLFNNSGKSAIQAVIELADNPTDIGVFSLNVGEGILNRF